MSLYGHHRYQTICQRFPYLYPQWSALVAPCAGSVAFIANGQPWAGVSVAIAGLGGCTASYVGEAVAASRLRKARVGLKRGSRIMQRVQVGGYAAGFALMCASMMLQPPKPLSAPAHAPAAKLQR